MLKRVRLAPVTIVVAALVVVLPLALAGLRVLWNVDDNLDRTETLHYPELKFNNAPEGTVYIDPLVKLGESDEHYAYFTSPPQMLVPRHTEYDAGEDWEFQYLNVTEESEIARLRRDGFVSLSLHYAPHVNVQFNADKDTYLVFYGAEATDNINEVFERYGGLRAAYVDENGKVLGVTDRAVRVYDNTLPSTLIADGSTLTLVVNGLPAWQAAVLSALTIAEFVLIAALGVLLLILIMRKLLPEQEKRFTVDS
ncbi:MAG: hypothetical protein K2J77_12340 [Oscillospiraceae bacterium]|nr:hypothetical protein [Oscillospiraceae bacterium]